MRDRLIDLLKWARGRCDYRHDCEECVGYGKGGDCYEYFLADYLLYNGVIVLPVTIGQPVWELCRWQHKETEIREGKVSMLQQKADKSWKIRISVNSSVYDITLDEIGKNVFLTKEAAEQALKGE